MGEWRVVGASRALVSAAPFTRALPVLERNGGFLEVTRWVDGEPEGVRLERAAWAGLLSEGEASRPPVLPGALTPNLALWIFRVPRHESHHLVGHLRRLGALEAEFEFVGVFGAWVDERRTAGVREAWREAALRAARDLAGSDDWTRALAVAERAWCFAPAFDADALGWMAAASRRLGRDARAAGLIRMCERSHPVLAARVRRILEEPPAAL